MSETILLCLFALVVLLIIFGARRLIASRQMKPLSAEFEAVIRISLCLLFAFIAFAAFHAPEGARLSAVRMAALLPVLASALIIYAVTHIFDRFLLK